MTALEALGMAVATGIGFGVGMKAFSLVDELVRLGFKWWWFERHKDGS